MDEKLIHIYPTTSVYVRKSPDLSGLFTFLPKQNTILTKSPSLGIFFYSFMIQNNCTPQKVMIQSSQQAPEPCHRHFQMS